MAEYNAKYLELLKRLSVLKLLAGSDLSLTDDQRNIKLMVIDSLLKRLDERYYEGKFLENIEKEVDKIEMK